MYLRFIKFNENVKMPVRMHNSDTGADFFLLENITLEAHETKVIGLGWGVEIPVGYTGKLQVRTSVAKLGIHIHQCAIDAGYTGEIHAIVTNMSNTPITFEKNNRIGYLEVYSCVYPIFIENAECDRKDGCIGSTGK